MKKFSLLLLTLFAATFAFAQEEGEFDGSTMAQPVRKPVEMPWAQENTGEFSEPVPFAYQRQADPLVAAGRLHDNAVRADQPFLLRLQNHIHGGPGLDGPAHVQRFHFDQDFRAVFFRNPVQPDNRRIADRLQDILTDQRIFLQTVIGYMQGAF